MLFARSNIGINLFSILIIWSEKMSLNFEIIKNSFDKYFADGKLLTIFLIALVFLMAEEKDKNNRNFLVYYPILLLVILLNPIFEIVISKIIGENVYYRFIWGIPIGVVISYFSVCLIYKLNKKTKKVIICICMACIVAFSGRFVYTEEVFQNTNNLYKLPDEYVEVIEILSNVKMENKKAMVSSDLIGYVRQLDASIKLPYQRRPYGDYDSYILKFYNDGDIFNLVDLCEEQEVNIIVYDNSILLQDSLESYGYELYANTEHYDIYVLATEAAIPEETTF